MSWKLRSSSRALKKALTSFQLGKEARSMSWKARNELLGQSLNDGGQKGGNRAGRKFHVEPKWTGGASICKGQAVGSQPPLTGSREGTPVKVTAQDDPLGRAPREEKGQLVRGCMNAPSLREPEPEPGAQVLRCCCRVVAGHPWLHCLSQNGGARTASWSVQGSFKGCFQNLCLVWTKQTRELLGGEPQKEEEKKKSPKPRKTMGRTILMRYVD